jgi:superfamily I DNA/RNA helicase
MADIHQNVVDYAGGHMRVLGPPASGKTSLVAERFRRIERDLGPGGAAVITYTRENRDRLNAELLAKRSARFGRVPALTYHRLALEIIGRSPASGGRVAGEMEESVLLDRALRRIARKLSSDYRNTVHSASFRNTILGVLHVLLQNGLTRAHRERLLEATRSPRLRDIIVVYDTYVDELRSHGFCTWYDVAWKAAEIVTGQPDFNPLDGVDFVLIDDFHDVDPGQYALIRALAPPAGKTSLNVFGDPTGARFRDRGTTDRFLAEVFPRDYSPIDLRLPAGCGNQRSLGRVVDELLRETMGEVAKDRVSNEEGVRVELTVATDELSEASYVAARVAEFVESGRYRPEDIAVAARKKHQYQSVLTRAFVERGVMLDTGGQRQHPFEYFVASLLRHLDDPGAESARSAVLTSPFLSELKCVHEHVKGQILDENETAGLEVIRTDIVRRVKNDDGAFDLEPLFDVWLRPLLDRSPGGRDSEGLLSFLGRLADEWKLYAEVIEGTKGRRSLSEFVAVSRALSAGDRGTPSHKGRVGFYSCRELSSRRFLAVFIVGCSELLFPALPSSDDYVPYEALEKVLRDVIDGRPVELHRARSNENFLRDEYALMLASLTRAGETLVLTAPEQHRGVTTPAPSQILRLVPDGMVERAVSRSASPFLRYTAALAAAGEATVSTSAVAVPERFDGHRISQLWWNRRPAKRTLTPAPKLLSPTSIQAFTYCQRRYFYERILHIKKTGVPALAFGTLFHDLMSKLSRENRTHEELRAAIQSKRLDEAIDNAINESDEYKDEHEMVKNAARFHLRRMAARTLELDAQRIDSYRIQSVEELVDFKHNDWQFGGRADRIDDSHSGRVVIDYKTGSVYKRGITVRKKALPGIGKPDERLWQIPLYCRGAQTDGGRYPSLFCYYVVQPEGDDYVAGLYLGEEDTTAAANHFGESVQKGFSHLTPEELEACLDEAAAVAEHVFEVRSEYPRTEDHDHCTRCDFKRVCERMM